MGEWVLGLGIGIIDWGIWVFGLEIKIGNWGTEYRIVIGD